MSIQIRLAIRVALLLVLLSPVSAFAQDAPKLGIVASTVNTVAVNWQFNERWAIRPELGFAFSHSEGNGLGAGNSGSAQQWTPGISAVFYFAKLDNLRTYVTPRYAWSHAHSSTTGLTGTTETNSSNHLLSGAVGAEYAIHRLFAGFGELGLSYSHTGQLTTPNSSSSYSIGPRVVAGVIFHF